jgi:hypothetical protein
MYACNPVILLCLLPVICGIGAGQLLGLPIFR